MPHRYLPLTRLLAVLLWVTLLPLAAPSLAAAPSAKTMERERALYRQAREARKAGRFGDFHDIVEKLRNYPLYPYLKLDALGTDVADLPFNEVRRFALKYQDSPAGTRMSNAWLRGQASKGRWQNILDHYSPGQRGEEFDCLYYRAALETGDRKTAFNGAARLWMVPYPQSPACDTLFSAWKTRHPITESMAWTRMQKAYANGKPQLASYLERYLGNARKPVAMAWRDVYADPSRLSNTPRFLGFGARGTAVVAHGLERLAIKDYEKAAALWNSYRKLPFSREELARVHLQIGKFMTVHFDPQAEIWLNEAQRFGAQGVAPIALRSALRAQDWERAERWLALGTEADRNQWMWQYWRARTDQWLDAYHARKNLMRPQYPWPERHRDLLSSHRGLTMAVLDPYRLRELFPTQVLALLEESPPPSTTFDLLSKERNYYGFLASERLGRPLTLKDTRYKLEGSLAKVVERSPALNRVLEFSALGMNVEARRELFHAVKYISEQEKIAAALIAHRSGWHLHAIQLAQHSAAQNDLSIRFPVLFSGLVKQRSKDAAIEPDWTYAVIRQESGFWQDALSPVGAMGYMQLMPGTAREVARSLGIRISNNKQVLNPDTNIRLGTTYLGQLIRRLDDSPLLATAGYNAGPGRARRWQPKDAPMPGDIWIETIPFQETRDYVKNVMTYQAIYRYHLGKPARLSGKMQYVPVFSR